ncbi:cytochrome P450 4C1-like isoform X2 [Leguminivora glycinivorella]|nr:cytochrome P450 4C1-like isoform X2 [Leguminivora glycinivorella]XP_047999526.1 cytochrome P450 4C1-like isoform X2 [Leguminivora glycinivorella]XP_047999527.1 cytochrome P450 4C1-like isoform X2 [Leguminivora glycinivorella]XP_047999528.1 cytochrome P450 4C1-like isoform X2 [Leguminivora glycinivorella]
MFLILVSACVLLACWARWFARRRLIAMADQLPGPPALPLLGNALMIMNSSGIFTVFDNLKRKYGRAFRFWLGPDLNYVISEPDYVKTLLQSKKLNERGPSYKYMVDFLGYGILSGSGPIWRQRRKLISSNYTITATKNYSNAFNDETGHLLGTLRSRPAGKSFDVYDEVVKTTTYAVCRTLFGLNREQTLSLPYLQEIMDDTHQMYADTFMRMTTWYLQIEPYYWFSPYYSKNKRFIQKINGMADAVVKYRLKNLKDTNFVEINESKTDLSDNEGLSTVDKIILERPANYDEMLKQIFTVFTTGQEPPANIGSFILLMMAYHPECQEKLYKEIKEVMGDEDRPVTDEDIKRMPYLDMVFKEVIRLFPIGPMMQRTVIEDIDIGDGITLPAGSCLTVLFFHMHRDKDFWENPDVFDPERFSPERSASRHPYCYVPFSLGSMDCLGRHFGTKLVKTICIRVLREFRLTSPETYTDLKLLCAVSVEPVNGYPVFLNPRLN